MRLNTKLTLSLLASLSAVVVSVQLFQHWRSNRWLGRVSEENLAGLEKVEWEGVQNVQQVAERLLRDSLAAGEMDRLSQLMEAYRNVEGLLDYSLFDKQGVNRYSSNSGRLREHLPTDLGSRVLTSTDKVKRRTGEAFEIYQPLVVTKKCLECHEELKEGEIGAVSAFRFSTRALNESKVQWRGKLMEARASNFWDGIGTTVFVGLAAALIAYVLVRRLVTAPLNRVITQVRASSNQVHATAAQISSGSSSLAEGSGAQAASLEETSSSLEEISAATKRNAQHADGASQLADQTRHAADTGARDMREMSQAMGHIKTANDEIAKIIKTIDGIAFQTNILALNAAVEAARAGKAGMGFAVVANEVRNLAQHSAQAARQTAGAIEDSIRRSERGLKISDKMAQSLNEMVAKAHQANELVAQIAIASREQSQGIEQVNTALVQMDKITQDNAANAEQSAGAAADLKLQAAGLSQAVDELLDLLHGSRTGSGDVRHPTSQASLSQNSFPRRERASLSRG